MKREFSINDIDFRISNYSARKNEYEKGLKYQLFHKAYFDFSDVPERWIPISKHSTLHQAKQAAENYSKYAY